MRLANHVTPAKYELASIPRGTVIVDHDHDAFMRVELNQCGWVCLAVGHGKSSVGTTYTHDWISQPVRILQDPVIYEGS